MVIEANISTYIVYSAPIWWQYQYVSYVKNAFPTLATWMKYQILKYFLYEHT